MPTNFLFVSCSVTCSKWQNTSNWGGGGLKFYVATEIRGKWNKKKTFWKFLKNFFPCPQLFDMPSPGLDSDGSSLDGTLSYGYLESNKYTTSITVYMWVPWGDVSHQTMQGRMVGREMNGKLEQLERKGLIKTWKTYPKTSALTSPISGGCSVGIVRSRTQAIEFSSVQFSSNPQEG
jgi:hypothetical protein